LNEGVRISDVPKQILKNESQKNAKMILKNERRKTKSATAHH